MSDMKKNSLRMLALVASFASTMTSSAAMVNDSILADTAQWYNKTHELSEVTVKSSLPKIRTNADGMKVIIAGSELEKAGNSKDLLKRLPSIKKVDKDGVELFGRGMAEIYVNGRKVYDNSELDQIPSDQIVNVEIITNPGARYKATTKAVVKIKTKRPQGEGWGFRDELKGYYRAGMSVRNQLDVNYRHGGLDIGGWVIGESSNTGQHQNERIESYIGNKLLVQDITETDFKAKSRDLDFGLKTNYIFNENHSIGARYEYFRLPYSKVDLLFPSKFTLDGEYLQESLSDVITREPSYRHNFNTYYSGKIANWQIDFNLDGVWFDHKQRGETSELISLPEQASRTDYVKTYTHNNSRLYAAKLVLEHPLFGGKVCLGTEYDDTRRTSVSENPKATDGDTKVDETITDTIRIAYDKMIYKKLSLDAMEIYNNPELLEFRARELFDQIKLSIERAIFIGDGRSAPAGSEADLRMFDSSTGTGLYPIATDCAAASGYGSLVASTYTVNNGDNLYDGIVGARQWIRSEGDQILVVKPSVLTEAFQAKVGNRYLIEPGATAEDIFRVARVFAPMWMEYDTVNDAYLLVRNGYTTTGERAPRVYPFFDVNTNSNILLNEMPLGGTLTKYKSAAAIKGLGSQSA